MGNAAPLVYSLTQKRIPEASLLPAPVWGLFSVFHKVHSFWRFFNQAEVYSNPQNFLGLVAGHTVRILFEDSLLVRIAAHTVLIATRIFACIEEQAQLKHSFKHWVDALHGRYIYVKSNRFKRSNSLASRVKSWYEERLRPLFVRIGRIVLRTLDLLKHFFLLSMKIMDAIDAFSLSPAVRYEGINTLFVSSSLWLTKLADNRELLIEGLQDNAEIIEEILGGLGSSLNVQALIAKTDSTMANGAKIVHKVESAADSIASRVNYYGRKELFQLMHKLELTEHIPKWLLPKTLARPWAGPLRVDPDHRHPPVYLLTRPSFLLDKSYIKIK